MMTKELESQLWGCANTHRLLGKSWESPVPGGSFFVQQLSDETIGIRIFIPSDRGYDLYKTARDGFSEIMRASDFVLDEEERWNYKECWSGWFREIHYMNKAAKQNKKELVTMQTSPVINIQALHAEGANVFFGDVANSSFTIDNSVRNIGRLIEEKGGVDKEELSEILKEAEEVAKNISESGKIKPMPVLKDRISKHFQNHSWFYKEIMSFLASTALKTLFPSGTQS